MAKPLFGYIWHYIDPPESITRGCIWFTRLDDNHALRMYDNLDPDSYFEGLCDVVAIDDLVHDSNPGWHALRDCPGRREIHR